MAKDKVPSSIILKGTGKRERTLEMILVCPHGGFRFAVGGFHVPSGDPRLFDPSIDSGP
jgi:hypothetical protein